MVFGMPDDCKREKPQSHEHWQQVMPDNRAWKAIMQRYKRYKIAGR
jgi:hypothetical protein